MSSRTLNHLADRIRSDRQQRGSRWRRLSPGRQALLALAHLRNGDTYARLAAGFEIGVATAWRYVPEAIALLSANVVTFADKGYQGARGSVRTPFKRRRFRPKLSRRQKSVNRAHAKIRVRGERAIATLKTWKVLIKLRCCPRRATAIVRATLVLHHVEADRYER
ncbi:hypothetical protein Aau02nite_63500 [Amorphoplanes auranticolor]|uniref:DDE superfamily endonuclease n=1 Tax=Actinoplanes auranticolor TaxID=47988 RepID=A0A919VSL5_9ACTN|nr:hypothetical protein Aau02nite_63500 [Actinoplanes auranticolor]